MHACTHASCTCPLLQVRNFLLKRGCKPNKEEPWKDGRHLGQRQSGSIISRRAKWEDRWQEAGWQPREEVQEDREAAQAGWQEQAGWQQQEEDGDGKLSLQEFAVLTDGG